MKKTISFIICILIWLNIGFTFGLFADISAETTHITGNITSDTTWDLAGSPYIIEGNIIVDNGVTLTIDPGVMIKFDDYYSIYIEGTLNAIGMPDNRITITSNKADPEPLDWGRIQVNSSGRADIEYCDIFYGHIPIFLYSSNNIIDNVSLTGFQTGIQLENSDNNNIVNCSFSKVQGVEYGTNAIKLKSSDYNNISGNLIENLPEGFHIQSSSYNRIYRNIFLNSSKKLNIWGEDKRHYDHIITASNSGDGKPIYYFFDRHYEEVYDLDTSHITIAWCDNFTIRDSIVDNDGIQILYSTNSSVNTCQVENNGIIVSHSENISISNCYIFNSYNGISLSFSHNITLTSNEIDNDFGRGLDVYGGYTFPKEYFNHTITSSNTINGKPVFYYFNVSDITLFKLDAGAIILAYCNNVDLSKSSIIFGDPLNLLFSSNITISDFILKGTKIGEETRTKKGIYLYYSNNNVISYCNISSYSDYGIYLRSSSNNEIKFNNIMYNSRSFLMDPSSKNNVIHHNNIFNNKYFSSDSSEENQWDNGYPSGGNYWSDYYGYDNYKGSNQDISGSDGIGDTPYDKIGGMYRTPDRYPLMKHVGWETTPPIISSVTVTNITEQSAEILWRTDENSDSRMNYSIYSDLTSSNSIFNSELATSHSLIIENLEPNTTYYFEIISEDNQSQNAIDNNFTRFYSFTTLEDVYPPIIFLNSPQNKSIIRPSTIIDFIITDSQIGIVTYSISGGNDQIFTSPFDISTNEWENGIYIVNITATDIYENTITNSFFFTIDGKPPSIISTTPTNGATKVKRESSIIIEFDERMNSTSVENSISIFPNIQGIQYEWNNDLTILTISFDGSLTNDMLYKINIGTNASDHPGNNMKSAYLLIFITGSYSGDSDEDGIPDIWELENFGDLSQSAEDDSDNDGFTNIQEYNENTDPDNSLSFPKEEQSQDNMVFIYLIVIIIVVIILLILIIYRKQKKSPDIDEIKQDSIPPPKESE